MCIKKEVRHFLQYFQNSFFPAESNFKIAESNFVCVFFFTESDFKESILFYILFYFKFLFIPVSQHLV